MSFISAYPHPSLSKYIHSFWMLEGSANDFCPYVHRVMAGGMAELVFHYKGTFDEFLPNGRLQKSFVSGLDAQSQSFKDFSIKQDFGIFGIQLYPYTIPYLFSYSAIDLKDQMIDLKTLLNKFEEGLEERIILAEDFTKRITIFSEFLHNRLGKVNAAPSGIFETINHIIANYGNTEVTKLAEHNFISIRQFQRNFKQYTGFSPKLFSRITRFQNVLNQKDLSQKSLTQMAMDAGYADQSHFIRDFKSFSGLTPKAYFKKE